jgi:ubiquinone/menaquinone biosynthesis C-methylase UbiE
MNRDAERAGPASPRRLDPRHWAAIYDLPDVDGEVFRRGSELAGSACLTRARRSEHWADVGCGTGHLTARLAAAGIEATGIDSDPRMVAVARARFGRGDRARTPRFEHADAAELPFEDGALDGLIAASLIGCLDQPAALLGESHRVLRPGGRAIITFTNRRSPLIVINWALRRLGGRGGRSSRYLLPVRMYSRREARTALERIGFEVEETRAYNFFVAAGGRMLPPPAAARSLERACGNRMLGSLLGRNLLIVARKPPS